MFHCEYYLVDVRLQYNIWCSGHVILKRTYFNFFQTTNTLNIMLQNPLFTPLWWQSMQPSCLTTCKQTTHRPAPTYCSWTPNRKRVTPEQSARCLPASTADAANSWQDRSGLSDDGHKQHSGRHLAEKGESCCYETEQTAFQVNGGPCSWASQAMWCKFPITSNTFKTSGRQHSRHLVNM